MPALRDALHLPYISEVTEQAMFLSKLASAAGVSHVTGADLRAILAVLVQRKWPSCFREEIAAVKFAQSGLRRYNVWKEIIHDAEVCVNGALLLQHLTSKGQC